MLARLSLSLLVASCAAWFPTDLVPFTGPGSTASSEDVERDGPTWGGGEIPELANIKEFCFEECGAAGPCNFCGTNGACCKDGMEVDGCPSVGECGKYTFCCTEKGSPTPVARDEPAATPAATSAAAPAAAAGAPVSGDVPVLSPGSEASKFSSAFWMGSYPTECVGLSLWAHRAPVAHSTQSGAQGAPTTRRATLVRDARRYDAEELLNTTCIVEEGESEGVLSTTGEYCKACGFYGLKYETPTGTKGIPCRTIYAAMARGWPSS